MRRITKCTDYRALKLKAFDRRIVQYFFNHFLMTFFRPMYGPGSEECLGFSFKNTGAGFQAMDPELLFVVFYNIRCISTNDLIVMRPVGAVEPFFDIGKTIKDRHQQ